jgi:DeoR/GlpR family transcriptional regulator of sugar metabolism
MTEKLTARQQAILAYIRAHQPVSNAQLAERFECAPATMTVHLMFIARAGLARSVGRAARARWLSDKPFTKPKAPPPVAPPSIEQVSSIWHYAARCARAA